MDGRPTRARVLTYGLLALLGALALTGGILLLRSGEGARVSVNVWGQQTVPAFMIGDGVVLLAVPVVAVSVWTWRRLVLRRYASRMRKQWGDGRSATGSEGAGAPQ